MSAENLYSGTSTVKLLKYFQLEDKTLTHCYIVFLEQLFSLPMNLLIILSVIRKIFVNKKLKSENVAIF